MGRELVDAADQLKWIQVSAAGVEWMPMEALARRGWTVTNAAGIHAIPVAETGIALLSGVARRVDSTTRNRVRGEWVRPEDVFELFEKTVGVIAMGGIGRAFAERASGLGMRVIGVDVNPASKPDCVDELRGIDELGWLLESSDVVCMTAPDTPKSHHMMNAERFAQMKEGSIFLNVSRGGLVDTEALIDAIDSGKFFGVGLDVIEGEPLESDHPIWSRDDMLITPHVGGHESKADRAHDRAVRGEPAPLSGGRTSAECRRSGCGVLSNALYRQPHSVSGVLVAQTVEQGWAVRVLTRARRPLGSELSNMPLKSWEHMKRHVYAGRIPSN